MPVLKYTLSIALLVVYSNISVAAEKYVAPRLSLEQKNAITATELFINQQIKRYHDPGLAIALVNDREVLWKQGFGVLSRNSKKPVNTKSLFSIESNSKMFTALGVLLAVQDRNLQLNVPIVEYLPFIHVHSFHELNPSEKVTLTHLLSHTAGFTHEAPLGNNYDFANASFDQHIKSILRNSWLIDQVGSHFHYSNIGYDLAGYILQNRYDMPFTQYMDTYVLQPLQMKSSTFDPKAAAKNPNTATGDSDSLKIMPINYSMLPSAGLYSNVEDLSQFVRFQLNRGNINGHILLAPKYLALTQHIPFPVNGQTQGYTLGLWKFKINDMNGYGHIGRGFGFSSSIFWFPQQKIGIIVLANHYGHDVDSKVFYFLLNRILPASINHSHKNQKMRPAIRTSLTIKPGNYDSDYGHFNLYQQKQNYLLSGNVGMGPFGNFQKQGTFTLLSAGVNRFYLTPYDDDTYQFVTSNSDRDAYFLRNRDGLVWYYNDGSDDLSGPNKDSWQKYLGTYFINSCGVLLKQTVSIKNGYLYFNKLKTKEMGEGIFQLPNGELVNLNPGSLNYKNILMTTSRGVSESTRVHEKTNKIIEIRV
jgi:CubicO group peptidase (beta-lactamase class C family)